MAVSYVRTRGLPSLSAGAGELLQALQPEWEHGGCVVKELLAEQLVSSCKAGDCILLTELHFSGSSSLQLPSHGVSLELPGTLQIRPMQTRELCVNLQGTLELLAEI